MPESADQDSSKPQPLGHHLAELRKAILYPLLVWGAAVVVGLAFQKQVVDALLAPIEKGIRWALERDPSLPRSGLAATPLPIGKNLWVSADGTHYVLRGRTLYQGRADGQPGWTYSAGSNLIDAALSPDGKHLALAAADGRVAWLDSESGRLRWDELVPGVQNVQFAADGPTLIAARSDGEILGLAPDHSVRFRTRVPTQPPGLDVRPINVAPLDVFMVIMKAAVLFGLIPGAPFLLYSLWKFTRPGLHAHERRIVKPILFFLIFLFVLGAAFAYFAVLPVLSMFLYELNAHWAIVMWDIRSFADLTILLMLAFGLVFEMPLVIILVTQIHLVTPAGLASQRRLIYLVVFILAAILTPGPDPFSQAMLALPTILLFEVGLYVSRILLRPRPPVETGGRPGAG
ncbi:MAG: twin-arginine translocase subunit TatC [Planctomycetes bacterium]|nr:twin-arginine translocase subunit TatC [Planctomycetota bacterium]